MRWRGSCVSSRLSWRRLTSRFGQQPLWRPQTHKVIQENLSITTTDVQYTEKFVHILKVVHFLWPDDRYYMMMGIIFMAILQRCLL